MKRALSSILSAETPDRKLLEMSIVQKESDLGLTFNKRLFVVINSAKFGYFSKYNLTDHPENLDIAHFKGEGEVKNITSLDQKKEILSIKFLVKNKNNKKQNKVWNLKFPTEDLAVVWLNKLNQHKYKSNVRKSQLSRSGSRSPISNSPSKSELKIQRVTEVIQKPMKSEVHEEVKTQLIFEKKQEKKSETHNNFYLGETPTIQQKSNEDDIDEMDRKKQEEENLKEIQKLSQMNRLREMEERQREEEGERKEREREIEMRDKEMAKWRMKHPYSEEESIRPQSQIYIESEQEPNSINFLKKSSTKKSNQFMKIELKKTKSKPKLKNIDYFDMVSKIVRSSDDGSSKKEDFIFDGEKKKPQPKEDQTKIVKRNHENLKLSSEYSWMYKFLIKQTEGEQYEVIKEFSLFCENILKSVIDEFELPERKRTLLPKYRKKQYQVYEVEDIEFKLAILDLKEVYDENQPGNRDRICNMANVKLLENEFKNYQILYKSSENREKVKIPLVCLSEYKGFVALFKAISVCDNHHASGPLPKDIENCLQNMADKCKSDYETFRAKDNTMLLKLNSKYYNELAAQIGKGHLSFDFYIIQQIKHLMPPDYLYQKKNNKQLNSKFLTQDENDAFLRQQLIQSYIQVNESIESILSLSLKKDRVASKLPKAIRNTQNANAKLQQLSQNVLTSITSVIKQFDEMNFYFMHPLQLSAFLHRRGINMRYLGYLYEYCNLPFAKSCLISEIASRSCKILLRKTLQDIQFEENSLQNLGHFHEIIIDRIIDFLNCVLGNTIETVTIWKVLSAHSVRYFNASLRPDSVQKGVFIISLVYHCGIVVDWSRINVNNAFQTSSFFTFDNLYDLRTRTKSLPPIISEDEGALLKKIEREDPSVYKQFIKEYQLEKKQLPSRIKNSSFYPKVQKYLASFIPPQPFDSQEQTFSHLKLYEYEGCPRRTEIDRQMLELKWYLRKRKKQKYITTCNNLLAKINNFFGDFHPLLSEVYETFSFFHKTHGEYDESITFCKSSVVNMLKICGTNHIKIGQAYYQLALCCIKSSKKEQAILNLKKAKTIFEANKKVDTVLYASVTLKLGVMFLNENKVKQAQNVIRYSIQIFQKMTINAGEFQDDIVEGYQLLARCYATGEYRAQEAQLGIQCGSKLKDITMAANLQKMIKISIYPVLSRINYTKASIFLDILSQLPIEANEDSYEKSYNLLRNRMHQNSLIDNLNSYVENLQQIQDYVSEHEMFKNQIPFNESSERGTVSDFLSLNKELIHFLGENYIAGALRQSL